MNPERFYVYEYLRAKDSHHGMAGTPYYVGKGSGGRAYSKSCHLAPPPREQERIVMVAEGISEDEAFSLEIALIALFGRIDLETGCLRNKTDGGDGMSGWICSDETRRKYSISRKGRKLTEEQRKKLRDANIGRVVTEETRAKLKGKIPWNKEKHISEETRQKLIGLVSWNKGISPSEETRKKISEAKKGQSLSFQVREKMKETCRAKNPNPSKSALRRRIWRDKKALACNA